MECSSVVSLCFFFIYMHLCDYVCVYICICVYVWKGDEGVSVYNILVCNSMMLLLLVIFDFRIVLVDFT